METTNTGNIESERALDTIISAIIYFILIVFILYLIWNWLIVLYFPVPEITMTQAVIAKLFINLAK